METWRAWDDRFDDLVRGWLAGAAREFGYATPPEEALAAIRARLPAGVRRLVARGHESGHIVPVGAYRFTLLGLPAGKGPYAWVSRSSTGVPAINWEYLVQTAEYVRIREAAAPLGLDVGFEDRLMDISVHTSDGDLLWYVEVKERASGLESLARSIAGHGRAGIGVEAPDRGDDPLRKAKALIEYRPRYFTLTAIGLRIDYGVHYTERGFEFIPDMVPVA